MRRAGRHGSVRRGARRRFQRRWPWVLALLIIALLVIADRSGLLLVPRRDDLSRYDGVEVEVSRVVSGHTIAIPIRDEIARRPTTHVRLWGVTAPLPAGHNREAEPLSDEAIEITRQLVENQRVTLRLESHRTRDTLGRLLAHVEIPAGGTLNEALLEAGLARADERWPHALLTRYAQAQQNAQRRSKGVWGTD